MFAGQAIHSMLKRLQARKTVYIDGLAASIASVVAMAGDRIIMPRNAMMMVHNPWTVVAGDAAELRKSADVLDQVREPILAAYGGKTGLTRDQLLPILDAETWMTAEEAVAGHFADQIEQPVPLAASAGKLVINGQAFDLRRFRHAPAALVIRGGVIPGDVSREKAPEDEMWMGPTLADFTDKSWGDLTDAEKTAIAGHYAWAEQMPPETFGTLKLPHHRSSDGAVVWRGVVNCAARMNQTDMPEADMAGVKAHLASHYEQFGQTPPWEQQAKGRDAPRNEGRTLSAANEQRIRDAAGLLDEVLTQLPAQAPPKEQAPSAGERQTPLSLFERRLQVRRNERRTAR